MTWKTAVAVALTALIVGGGVYWWQRRWCQSSAGTRQVSRAHERARVGEDTAARSPQQPMQQVGTPQGEQSGVVRELTEQVNSLEEELERRQSAFTFERGTRTTGRLLRVYEARDYDVVFYHAVPEPVDSSLAGKLRLLASLLSEHRFGLPLEVTGVESRAGKTIATINLKGEGWCRVFSSSFGATCAEATLRETFRQPEYEGEWVDSAELRYEGGSLDDCRP